MTADALPVLPLSAAGVALRWRAPTRSDIPAWAALLEAVEAVDRNGERHTPEDLDDEFATSWTRPDSNARFAFDPDGAAVAFGWVQAQPQHERPHRFALWGGVHPRWRGHGIGRQLLAWLEARGRQVYVEFGDELGGHLAVTCDQHHREHIRTFARAGFTPLRSWFEMERALGGDLPPLAVPGGLRLVALDPSLDEAVRRAHNEAFADHWGSRPADPETWRQWYAGHRSTRRDLSAVVLDGGAVAGYALNALYPQDFVVKGRSEGWVATLGVRRPWRGRGLARALLAHSLKAFADEGLAYAVLGVDTESTTGALHLYEQLGFRPYRRTLTYAKPLP